MIVSQPEMEEAHTISSYSPRTSIKIALVAGG